MDQHRGQKGKDDMEEHTARKENTYNQKEVGNVKTEDAIYALSHFICSDGGTDVTDNLRKALNMAIASLRAQQKAEKNEPLTTEELRGMAEQPYYHVSLQNGQTNHWVILPEHVAKAIEDYHYGEYWLAYRFPPKEAHDGSDT